MKNFKKTLTAVFLAVSLATVSAPAFAIFDATPAILALQQLEAQITKAFRVKEIKALYDQINGIRDMANRIGDLKGAILQQAREAIEGQIKREKVVTAKEANAKISTPEKEAMAKHAVELSRTLEPSKVTEVIAAECKEKLAAVKAAEKDDKTPAALDDGCQQIAAQVVAAQELQKQGADTVNSQRRDGAVANRASQVSVAAANAAGKIHANTAAEGADRLDPAKATSSNAKTVSAVIQQAQATGGGVNPAALSNLFTPLTGIDGRSFMNREATATDSGGKFQIVSLTEAAGALLAKILVAPTALPMPVEADLLSGKFSPDLMVKRFSRFAREQFALSMIKRLFDKDSNDRITEEITMMRESHKLCADAQGSVAEKQLICTRATNDLLLYQNLQALAERRGQWETNALLGLLLTNGSQTSAIGAADSGQNGQQDATASYELTP